MANEASYTVFITITNTQGEQIDLQHTFPARVRSWSLLRHDSVTTVLALLRSACVSDAQHGSGVGWLG